MGNSYPPSSFCVSTAANESSEPKVYKIKSFLKLVLLSDGAWAMDVLILLNASFSESVHFNCALFLTICCKGLTIWAKSGTNLHTKLIVPIKYYIPFLLWGKRICSIALILSSSMEILFVKITWPNSFPSVTANTHFLGFKEMPYFLQRSKIYFKYKACPSLFLENIVTSSNRLKHSSQSDCEKLYP